VKLFSSIAAVAVILLLSSAFNFSENGSQNLCPNATGHDTRASDNSVHHHHHQQQQQQQQHKHC